MVARGYGTAFTSACLFYASDRLGMAQQITKTILALSNNDTSKFFVIPVLISEFSKTMADAGEPAIAMMNEFITTLNEESAKHKKLYLQLNKI